MAPSLQSRLDRDVHQVLKKLEETINEGKPFKTATQVYEAIKRSNSYLSRQKKRPLEDSIDRVLQFRKAELDDSEDSEAALEDDEPVPQKETGFLLNRQLTKHWNVKPVAEMAKDKDDDRPAKRKRGAQESGEDPDNRQSGNEAGTPVSKPRSNGTVKEDGLDDKNEQNSAPVQKKLKKPSRFQVERPSKPQRLGGVADIQNELFERMQGNLKLPDVMGDVQWHPGSGLLVSGPTGIGKRSLVRSVAAQLEVPIIALTHCFADPERMERSLVEAFDEALHLAPSVILIEDLDHHMSKPGSTEHNDHHKHAVSLFRREVMRLHESLPADRHVLAVATCSNINDIAPQLLTFGLFHMPFQMRVPDGAAREDIFRVATEGMSKADDVNYTQLARLTHGFTGADIKTVISLTQFRIMPRVAKARAASKLQRATVEDGVGSDDLAMVDATNRENPDATMTMEDLRLTIKDFTPSLRKEGFTAIPNVSWEQVGALQKVREQMEMSIIGPIKNPDVYETWGLKRPAGVLLWGPPGCGKTLVAQAVANEAQASFILINGPEILNKYVGESERAVREAFQRARASTPCILFFDEIDSVAHSRESSTTDAGSRIVAALLTELDGVNDRSGIYVIGTTNRPDKIDDALLRPGRLSVRMLVDLPSEDERVDILRTIFRSNHPRATEAEMARLEKVARDPRCENFSGADLQGLRVKAAEYGLRQWMAKKKTVPEIEEDDWEHALANTHRSVRNPEQFRRLEEKLGKE